ncbi:hypothetical protein ARTHRO9AX_130018 [Arthrobacter sp. 9AX]|nr:hypothetical protein ARTHRO9AX_130018 [Arthrobacter sp. 9AX]
MHWSEQYHLAPPVSLGAHLPPVLRLPRPERPGVGSPSTTIRLHADGRREPLMLSDDTVEYLVIVGRLCAHPEPLFDGRRTVSCLSSAQVKQPNAALRI